MSNLAGGGPTLAANVGGRAQNGGSQATPGPVAVPSRSGVKTPTQVMQQRRNREAAKKAQMESLQGEQDEEEQRQAQERAHEEEMLNTARKPVGVAVRGPSGEELSNRRSRNPTEARRLTGGGASASQAFGDKTGRANNDPAVNPALAAQPPVYVPSNVRKEKAAPVPQIPRSRVTSLSQPSQPKPVQHAPRAASATQQPSQIRPTSTTGATGNFNSRSQIRVDPPTVTPGYKNSVMPLPLTQPGPEPTASTQQRPNASSFPHAFERWETLSSHWEGLTSYWIRRLEQNSDEMTREPLNQQLARQVTDLSAAGANLFHAVVELQRLRASSERKFQRWFFETRAEQERAHEVQAGMEKALNTERAARAEAVADLARIETEKNTAYQMRGTAEQMVKEMRRELQISKEEARRAWEELGRREQEERDRTTSLRNGEPTLVGGVQVVPMMQGAPSRQASMNQPSAKEGPLPSGSSTAAGATGSEAVAQSLDDESGYTVYDPARSETDTDPFTESGGVAPSRPAHSEPELPSLPTAASLTQQQTSSNSSTIAKAKEVRYPELQQPSQIPTQPASTSSAPGRTYLSYGPMGPAALNQAVPSSFYQHEGSALNPDERQPRIAEPDERSYVQSIDTLSEEDPELDENGEIRRDAEGRRVFNRRGFGGSENSDEYDVQDQLERERMYGQRYGSGITGVEYGHGPTSVVAGGGNGGGGNRSGAQYSGAPAAGGTQPAQGGAQADYSGSGYGSGITGWEAVPRHHHPTRLSDVLEEDERSRTSPSRASQTSRGLRQ